MENKISLSLFLHLLLKWQMHSASEYFDLLFIIKHAL